MSIITVVGAGMMGSAITFPAADNGNQVRLVGTPFDRAVIDSIKQSQFHPKLKLTLPESVKAYYFEELEEAMDGCELLISGVPSFGVDWFVENVLTKVPEGMTVLSLTKGLEDGPNGELLPISRACLQRPCLKGRHFSVNAIGGPCISYELCARRHTTVALCGDNMGTIKHIKAMLETDYYHIYVTTDVIGIECAVAMKNAYAVGVALAIGIAQSRHDKDDTQWFNPQAALFGQSMTEMIRLIQLLGGRSESVVYASSDLYVTIEGGRNRQLGVLLGQGLSFEEAKERLAGVTLESISIIGTAARALRRRTDASVDDFPLLRHLDELLFKNAKLDIPWKEFVF